MECFGEHSIQVATTYGKLSSIYLMGNNGKSTNLAQGRDYDSAVQCLLKVQQYQQMICNVDLNGSGGGGDGEQVCFL